MHSDDSPAHVCATGTIVSGENFQWPVIPSGRVIVQQPQAGLLPLPGEANAVGVVPDVKRGRRRLLISPVPPCR